MLVMAIDFGRVFFGWVALQNVARIGASFAAAHPQAWDTPGHPDQTTYRVQMEADAAGINCTMPAPLPTPTFPEGAVLGGDAVVSLSCDFTVITPLAGAIVGDPITVRATSVFPIRTGCPGCAAPPPAPPPSSEEPAPEEPPPVETTDPCITVPDLVGLSVAGARNLWTWSGFVGDFSPAAGADDARTVISQTTTPPTPASPYNCLEPDATVSVFFATLPDPPDPTCSYVPNLLGIGVGEARQVWVSAGFPENGFTPPATEGVDAQIVKTQTVGPTDVPPDTCVTDAAAATVTVTYGPPPPPPAPRCKVPSLIGVHTSEAEAVWASYRFTSKVIFEKKKELIPPGYVIQRQNLVADSWVDCSENIKVGPEP